MLKKQQKEDCFMQKRCKKIFSFILTLAVLM